MTETLTARIARHEGFRSTPYLDSLGHATVGFGHLLTESETQQYANGISQDDALDLLNQDIAKAQAEVNGQLPWISQLSELRQEVVVEVAFQLGLHGLMGFKDFLFNLRQGNFDAAAHAMLDSNWHIQTPARCEELAAIMLNDTAE